MATIEKQAIQLMANEITKAIKKYTEENNKRYVDNQIKNIDIGSIAKVSVPMGDYTGTIDVSQILNLDGAISTYIYEASDKAESGDKDAQKVISAITGLAAIEVKNAKIDTAQIENLYASVADIIYLSADKAEIGDLDAQKITSAIADLGLANIGSADIGFAQIKDLATETAIIREGLAGELYIDRLKVTQAQILTAIVGNLILQGTDGKLHQIWVDENGEVKTTPREITGNDVADGTIEGSNIKDNTITGALITEDAITARELNVSQIFADEALIGAIKAQNIDVANLFANNGFIASLETSVISSPKIGEEIDISKNSSITLTNGRISLMVEAESTSSELILTDQMIQAIGDKFSIIANEIDLSANESIDARVKTVVQEQVTRQIACQETAPKNPIVDELWLDTSVDPNVLKRWGGSSWLVVNDTSDIITTINDVQLSINDDITAVAERVTKNENSVSSLNQSVQAVESKLTPDGIFTYVKDSDQYKSDIAGATMTATKFEQFVQGSNSISAVTQDAEKINWIVGSGTSASNMALTDDFLRVAANNINLSANNSLSIIVGEIQEDYDTKFTNASSDYNQKIETAINNAADDYNTKINSTNNKINNVESSANQQIAATNERIDSVDTKILANENKITETQSSITAVRDNIMFEVNSVSSSVSTLDQKVTNSSNELNNKIDNKASELGGQISGLEDDIGDLGDQIATLDQGIDGRVTEIVSSSINVAKGEIELSVSSSISTSIGAAKTEINNSVDSKVGAAKKEINSSVDSKVGSAKTEAINQAVSQAVSQAGSDADRKISGVQGNVDALGEAVSQNATDIKTNQDNIDKNAEDIAANVKSIGDQNAKIQAVETSISNLTVVDGEIRAEVSSTLKIVNELGTDYDSLSKVVSDQSADLTLTAGGLSILTEETKDRNYWSTWFTFTTDGLTTRRPEQTDDNGNVREASAWSTLIDETGYHIDHDSVPNGHVGSFSKENLETRGYKLSSSPIVIRPSSTGGWVWTD